MNVKSTKTDLLGKQFGKWIVIAAAQRIKRATYWLCRCECGREVNVAATSLKKGVSKSCGKCEKRVAGTPEYESWSSMMNRVLNKSHMAYHRYGGRGIEVCDKWKSFSGFYEDMGVRPKGTTLDRIDNDGNYCKENCRWATSEIQANNTSWNRKVEYAGEIYTVANLSKILGIKYTTLRKRILENRLLDAKVNRAKK